MGKRATAILAIFVPVYGEGQTFILDYLPMLASVVSQLTFETEVLLLHRPTSVLTAADLARMAALHSFEYVEVSAPGKWSAIKSGLSRSKASVIVMLDADVTFTANAVDRMSSPVLRGACDCVAGRPSVRKGRFGIVPALLNRWTSFSFMIWHEARRSNQTILWALPGYGYCLRREYFPSEVCSPLVEDASIGWYALCEGAQIVYDPEAIIGVIGPQTIADWLRQKIRIRAGWVAIRSADPFRYEQLMSTLRHSAKKVQTIVEGMGWKDRVALHVLIVADAGLRVAAQLARSFGLYHGGTWAPVRSTK